MTLDQFGAGCRCLLRARENSGQPYIREEAFIAARLSEYPDWVQRPGAASEDRLICISQELGLARSGRSSEGYWDLMASHEQGEIILVRSPELLPASRSTDQASEPVALLTHIDSSAVTLWMPTPDGRAETLTIARQTVLGCKQPVALVLSVQG